ncbi:MAG: DUF2225 domain-containing protein [Planctomycetota bacterium]|jgi:hypothetical protein
MSAKNDPFVRIATKCPICERESDNRYLKSKMYQPLEVEDDKFVKTYKWELEQFKVLRPEYYHIWHCSNCHFCEEKEVFRGEDDLSGKVEILQEKLLIETKRPESIFGRLGELIDFESEAVSWSSALAAHVLAIYIHNQLSPNMRLAGKLARFYLRTAWLYREKSYSAEAGGKIIPDPELSHTLAELKTEWPDGPFDEDSAMSKAIEYYKLELENIGRTDNIRQEVSVMMLLMSMYLKLERKKDAMDYIRIIFRSCTKRRSSTQKAVENIAKRKDVSSKQIEHVKTLLVWLNNTIERTVQLSEKITEEIFQEEYPKAREKVIQLKEPTPESILEMMREEGFYDATCRRVVDIFKKNLISINLENLSEAEAAQKEKKEKQKNKGFFSKIADIIKGEEEEE